MKIAFNILPVFTDYDQVHLLVEAGSYGVSFAWFTKEPFNIRGLAIYQYNDLAAPGSMASEIEHTLQASPVYNKAHASVTICFDFKESLLVPIVHFKESTAGSLLNMVYAIDQESNYKIEHVKGHPVVNVYAVHKKIEDILLRQFPSADIHHATSLQIEKFQADENRLHCIFFHNCIKVFLLDGSVLHVVQQFNYNTPVDAAYHLLNCCEQYNFKPSEIKLVLSGMIDGNSKLYTELFRYFLNIEFEETDSRIKLHDRIKFYPGHFFSHLTGLASCVS